MGTASARRNLQNSGNNPQAVIRVDESGNRERPASAGDNLNDTTQAPYGAAQYGFTNTVFNRIYTASGVGDADTGTTNFSTALQGFNGTTWDRLRALAPAGTSAAISTNTGILHSVMVGSDGTNFRVPGTTIFGDASSDSVNELMTMARHSGFNGTTWDRVRNNTDTELLASAARTTTQTSADLVNYNAKALQVVLDMTTVGTGSVTVSIDMKDTASGKYINLLTGAAITTNSTNRYRVGPNLAAVANSVAQDYMPRVFRIVVTANNANSATYSVGYHLTA